jgi:calnexin
MIDNPLYKGKWSPPKIPNPAYKGVWTPRQIPNPSYFYEPNPIEKIPPMTALAVEIWTTNAGIHFDNFIITADKEQLHEFTRSTWSKKSEAESEIKASEASEARKAERERIYATGKPAEKINAFISSMFEYLGENPMTLAISLAAIVVPLIYLFLFGGRNPSVDVNGNPVEYHTESEPTHDDAAPATTKVTIGGGDPTIEVSTNAGEEAKVTEK